jgi:ferredoxin
MKFRHNLAKETFKGKKKNTERGVEDLIDPDQRGNHSSAIHEPSPLILDKETITPQPVESEPREMSRRDMFSFGNFLDFGAAVEDETEAKKSRKKKSTPLADEKSESIEETYVESVEEVESPETPEETESPQKEGFFKRLVSKFKESPEEKRLLRGEELLPPEESEFTPEQAGESNSPEATVGHNIFEVEEVEDKEYDRRNLLRQGAHFFAKPVVQNVQSKIDNVNKAVDKITKRVPLLRPPGAISEKQFLQSCSRCDECIHACPKDAIVRAPKKMGFLVYNTPYIDPMRNPVSCAPTYHAFQPARIKPCSRFKS